MYDDDGQAGKLLLVAMIVLVAAAFVVVEVVAAFGVAEDLEVDDGHFGAFQAQSGSYHGHVQPLGTEKLRLLNAAVATAELAGAGLNVVMSDAV